jgi:hypothetical protein
MLPAVDISGELDATYLESLYLGFTLLLLFSKRMRV